LVSLSSVVIYNTHVHSTHSINMTNLSN